MFYIVAGINIAVVWKFSSDDIELFKTALQKKKFIKIFSPKGRSPYSLKC